MSLSLSNLRDLPEGAEYAAEKGRAKVKVRIRDSLLWVTASCDSLQKMIEIYAQEATFHKAKVDSLYRENKQMVEKRKQTTSFASPFRILSIGLFIGALATTLLFIKITPKKKTI